MWGIVVVLERDAATGERIKDGPGIVDFIVAVAVFPCDDDDSDNEERDLQ